MHRIIYVVPVLLGAFMVAAACFGYGKPPARWYARLLSGGMGSVLVFCGVRLLIFSR
jgi:hypothetical protein